MESFWLCDDCLFGAAYEDYSALSLLEDAEAEQHERDIRRGLMQLAPLSADFDAEQGWGIQAFSRSPCDCCHSSLHGQRHRFTRI